MYKDTTCGNIYRQHDGAYIPPDPLNTDYQEYLKWLAEGNTPIPADPPVRDVAAEIAELERAHLMPRATREFMLTFMEASFTPQQLAAHVGYQKGKALDDQIRALRALL